MDVEIDMTEDVFVNNRSVDMDTRVYDNFTLEWTTLAFASAEEPVGNKILKKIKNMLYRKSVV